MESTEMPNFEGEIVEIEGNMATIILREDGIDRLTGAKPLDFFEGLEGEIEEGFCFYARYDKQSDDYVAENLPKIPEEKLEELREKTEKTIENYKL